MMSENKKLVPKRRFKEFKNSNAWEQRKFSELNIYFTDGNYGEAYPKPKDFTDSSLGVPFLTGGNLRNGMLSSIGVSFISKSKHEELQSGHLQYDDIVIAVRGSLGSLGYVNRENVGWNINSQLAIIRTDKLKLSGKYVIQYMLSDVGQIKLLSMQTGSALKQLPIGQLKDYCIPITNLEEQIKIGDYLTNLDNLITLHQRKLEKMKALKAAYLSELFPADGERKPKRRFKGFTNAWEQRKLKQLANFTKGQGYSKSDLTDAGTPVILYGRLYTKYQSTISEVDTFVVPKIGSVYSTGKEVIVPASGETAEDIARASAVVKSGILLGGDLNIIYPNNNISTIFLALSISNGKQKKELSKKAQGKSVVHLHNADLEGVTITYPCKEEQEKIESVFSNIDNLITLHQRNLEKLQNIKNAYLNEMFVGGGR